MIVDIESKEEKPVTGTFELPGGGKVHLKLLSARDMKEIRKACIKTRDTYPWLPIDPDHPEKGSGYRHFESPDFNGELFAEMSHDRNITGWEDLFDGKENPIPVTKENKVLLMSKKDDGERLAPEFVETVQAGNKALAEEEKKGAEAAEKN
jgi:hypothetical protein